MITDDEETIPWSNLNENSDEKGNQNYQRIHRDVFEGDGKLNGTYKRKVVKSLRSPKRKRPIDSMEV